MRNFEISLENRDERARAGLLVPPHGLLETPLFAPVGMLATVKALTSQQVKAARGGGEIHMESSGQPGAGPRG